MSEQKTISPLLDGFTMGNPMSDHDGVSCRPAIKENTEKQYIVKIISIPASQRQMDALLLAGAFKDPSGAMAYYQEVADDVVKEAELLQKLSRLEGFLPYEGWQIEPITRRRLGYEVYLISSYKRSLEKHLHRNPVTQLEAVNLGLDICTALSVCRQAGALYVDLKPSNIFISDRREYRIGDLGFVSLDALHYTTVPKKYHSAYSPPELEDPMATLNTTADTYALGMILYQLYNDSQLPSQEDIRAGTIPSPVNADYEMAEILLKAIHPDPQQRWTDPAAMGQALVAYMQRNSVNDVPITPHTPLIPESETEQSAEETHPADEVPESSQTPDAQAIREEAAPGEKTVQEKDDSAPDEADADLLLPHEMSEELSQIVEKANDLIAHELPEGVVVPEAPELPDPFAFAAEDNDDADDIPLPTDPELPDPADPLPPEAAEKKKKRSKRFLSPERKRKVRRLLTGLLFTATVAAVGLCCWLYYQLFYLIPVHSITLDSTEQQITVRVDTTAEESALKVICTDAYGNVRTGTLTGGRTSFDSLLPDTAYTIRLEIEGFHKLSGTTSAAITTDANTNILSFTSMAGEEDGSLILSFNVDGDEADEWTVLCRTEGEEDRIQYFTGHSVTVRDLTIGKVYTFLLGTTDNLTLSGMTSLEVMASRLILAENLAITSADGTEMTLTWNAPGDVVVDSWDVHVYNIKGFDRKFTVTEPKAQIPDADPNAGYTIEVTASGMTQPARITVTEDPLTVTRFQLDNEEDTVSGQMNLSWEFSGEKPRDGWLLMYTVDGSGTPSVVKCKDASAVVSPRIPGGKYTFTLQTADGTTVFNNLHRYTVPEAASFQQYNLSAETVKVHVLKTPEKKNWHFEDISITDFADTFCVGDKVSLVLRADSAFYMPGSETRILYVYRDPYGNVIPGLASLKKTYWKNIWTGGDVKAGELDVPTTPEAAGSYVLELYLDGMILAKLPVTFQ